MRAPAGILVLPVSSLLQWPVKCNGSGRWTIIDTATTVPAFLRMQDDRWVASRGMGYEYIYLADFYTYVTTVTYFRVENYRCVWGRNIRNSIYFFFSHKMPPFY